MIQSEVAPFEVWPREVWVWSPTKRWKKTRVKHELRLAHGCAVNNSCTPCVPMFVFCVSTKSVKMQEKMCVAETLLQHGSPSKSLIAFSSISPGQKLNISCSIHHDRLRGETAKDNCQTTAWISRDLTRNNEPAFSSTTTLQFYRFQIMKFFFFYISLCINK